RVDVESHSGQCLESGRGVSLWSVLREWTWSLTLVSA
ncbi:rCG51544, partial [Rattus norvegicus]